MNEDERETLKTTILGALEFEDEKARMSVIMGVVEIAYRSGHFDGLAQHTQADKL